MKLVSAKREKIPYYRQVRDGRWIRKRNAIMDAAKCVCEACGTTDDLQVHHTFYLSSLYLWEYPPALLMVLCGDCHVARQDVEQNIHLNVATVLRDKTLEELKQQKIYAIFDHPEDCGPCSI